MLTVVVVAACLAIVTQESAAVTSSSFLLPSSRWQWSLPLSLAIGLTVGLTRPATSLTTPAPSSGVNSAYRMYSSAAISSETNICARIGIKMLNRGGSAVDAAVATMFCVGVVNCHSTGIGGGHFATIYEKPRNSSKKELVTLLSREKAPQAAFAGMYLNKSSQIGGLAIAVPGEVRGHYEAWNRFGRLPWRDLIEPTIALCDDGFTVERALSIAIKSTETGIRNNANLAELFVKRDGTLVTEGDLLVNKKLAQTLRRIAKDPLTYYDGDLAADIVADIQETGGIITKEDLRMYSSRFKVPVNVSLANGNYRIYNPPPPSSGVVLDFILRILDGYKFSSSSVEDASKQTLTYHRIAEAFKFAYAKRSQLGDADFVNVVGLMANLTSPEFADEIRQRIVDDRTQNLNYYEPTFDIVQDKGTTHINVMTADGSAVSMTSTINLYFGSQVRGSRTGIIFNDEMDDFSTPNTTNFFGVPASPSNYIVPGKMPMSSMSPSLVFDSAGKVVYMSGASGGTTITTGVAFVLMNSLWFNKDLKTATDAPRIHHQLVPQLLNYEATLNPEVVSGLAAKNHTMAAKADTGNRIGSIRNRCTADSVVTGQLCIEAVSDGRKGGTPDGY